jgi:hypothetical protein
MADSTLMDRDTEHERPAKRAKRDQAGGSLIPPPINHANEDSDAEEPGIVPDKGVAHGSDLYLDTV